MQLGVAFWVLQREHYGILMMGVGPLFLNNLLKNSVLLFV